MTKDVFLSMLEHRLLDGGMPKDKVDESIAHFNTTFSKMSQEEFEEKIARFGGEAAIADGVISNYKKSLSKAHHKAEEAKEPTQAPAQRQPSVKRDVKELLEEDDEVKEERVKPVKRKKAPPVKAKRGGAGKNPFSNMTPGTAAAVPAAAILMLLQALLFATVYCLIGAAVIMLAALLVLLSATGTALAIVAIIYGITQLPTSKGAGLYEIGIGIVIGGLTLFVGILMYNFIVRLAPFIFRKLFVFYKFVLKQIKRLYALIKEACDNR